MARSLLGLGICKMVIIHPQFSRSNIIIHTYLKNLSGLEIDRAMIRGDHGLSNNSNDHQHWNHYSDYCVGSGVLQISPTKRILVPRIKEVVVGVGFRFRIPKHLLVLVALLEEIIPSR